MPNLGFEDKKSESTTFNVLKKNSKNIFYRYWYVILPILIILFIVRYFLYKYIYGKILKKKIKRMIIEKKFLLI